MYHFTPPPAEQLLERYNHYVEEFNEKPEGTPLEEQFKGATCGELVLFLFMKLGVPEKYKAKDIFYVGQDGVIAGIKKFYKVEVTQSAVSRALKGCVGKYSFTLAGTDKECTIIQERKTAAELPNGTCISKGKIDIESDRLYSIYTVSSTVIPKDLMLRLKNCLEITESNIEDIVYYQIIEYKSRLNYPSMYYFNLAHTIEETGKNKEKELRNRMREFKKIMKKRLGKYLYACLVMTTGIAQVLIKTSTPTEIKKHFYNDIINSWKN